MVSSQTMENEKIKILDIIEDINILCLNFIRIAEACLYKLMLMTENEQSYHNN
jgi:hypothetical protein